MIKTPVKYEIAITIVAVFALTLYVYKDGKLATAERYIKQTNKNCIVVRKIDPIGDLQRFFNKQDNKRYACGPEDSVPGPIFRQAAENWRFDQTCDELVARMPKE